MRIHRKFKIQTRNSSFPEFQSHLFYFGEKVSGSFLKENQLFVLQKSSFNCRIFPIWQIHHHSNQAKCHFQDPRIIYLINQTTLESNLRQSGTKVISIQMQFKYSQHQTLRFAVKQDLTSLPRHRSSTQYKHHLLNNP